MSTWAGTPVSTAAATVQRPSPESDTRPLNPATCGSWSRAWAVRSSNQELTTLPRRSHRLQHQAKLQGRSRWNRSSCVVSYDHSIEVH